MTFFQPDCGWCLRQARALNRLHQTCGADISLLAVGVHGSRRELKQELRRLRPRYAAYQASAALLASLGGAPPTPFSLVAGRDGRFLAWMQGYLPPEEVAEQFQGLPPACTPNRTPVRPS